MSESTRRNVLPRNLGAVLESWARLRPNRIAYRFLTDGETEAVEVTYAELDLRARAIAVALLESLAPGEPAVLLFPPGLDFIAASSDACIPALLQFRLIRPLIAPSLS